MVDALIRFAGSHFVLFMGLFYLIAKMIIRQMVHKLVVREGAKAADGWGAFAWSGVDIAVLTLGLSIAANVPSLKDYTYHEEAIWYSGMALSLFISALMYGFFIKRRKSMRNLSPIHSPRLAALFSGCMFFGVVFFPFTLAAIVR